MKRFATIVTVVFAAAALPSLDVDAKRLGGGKSVGAPRDTVTHRQQAQPTTPQNTQQATTPQNPAASAAKAAPSSPPSGMSRWLGPLAGLAAGLGLAALFSSLGLDPGMGLLLLLIALAVGAFWFMRKMRGSASAHRLQYAAAGDVGSVPESRRDPMARNDFGFGGGVRATVPSVSYPPGFDPDQFLQHAKVNFARLQKAYDSGELDVLQDVLTPEMFAEIRRQLDARGPHYPTEIMKLDAELLEVVTETDHAWASVRFHGLLREQEQGLAQGFDEVWNLRKPLSGETGWLLAGIQQLS